MTWTVHSIAQLSHFAHEWDALVRSRPGTPFLKSQFVQPIVAAFGNPDARLCLNHSGGLLCAAAILQRGRMGMWQTFQPSQLPLGAWISRPDVDLLSECKALMRQLTGLTLGIGLTQLDSKIQARLDDGPVVRTQDYIQTAWVDINGSFETYWEARGKNLKQNTRKQRNKLKTEGVETRIDCVTAAQDISKAIEDYGILESAGWKAADGTAVHPNNAQGRFYREMLENFCRIGQGRVYRYWFGEKLVAMDLCIHDDTVIVVLKTVYDESYKAVSPSTLMRQDQFQQIFEERAFKRIEFYGKVMEWHTRWTDNARALYHANVYSHASVLRLLDVRARMRRPTAAPTPA